MIIIKNYYLQVLGPGLSSMSPDKMRRRNKNTAREIVCTLPHQSAYLIVVLVVLLDNITGVGASDDITSFCPLDNDIGVSVLEYLDCGVSLILICSTAVLFPFV